MSTLKACSNYAHNKPAKIVLSHPELANHIIKVGCNKQQPRVNLTRIMVANKINEFIDWPVLNISRVKKIHKQLYHRSNRPHDLTDFNYVVISEKINGKPYDQTPLQQYNLTKKLNDDAYLIVNLITPPKAPHLEFSLLPENIFITNDIKVAFIDTEIEREYFKDKILDEAFSLLNTQEINFLKKHPISHEEQVILDGIFNNLNQKTTALLSGKFDFFSTKDISNLLTHDGFRVLQAEKSFVLFEHKKLPNYTLKIGLNNNNSQVILSEVLLCDKINRIIGNNQNNINLIQKIFRKFYHRTNQPLDLIDKNYIVLIPKITVPHDEYKRSVRIDRINKNHALYQKLSHELTLLNSKLTMHNGHQLTVLFNLSNMIMLESGKIYILDLPLQNKSTVKHLCNESLNFWPTYFPPEDFKEFFGFLLLSAYKN